MIVVREQAMQAKRPIPECWRNIAERSFCATPGNETRFYSGMSVDVTRRSRKLAPCVRPFVGSMSEIGMFKQLRFSIQHGWTVISEAVLVFFEGWRTTFSSFLFADFLFRLDAV